MAPPAQPILELQKLTVRFGGLTAVESIDLVVRPGEIVSIIGPNGAGKTTLFNAVSGVGVPTSGKILFKGEPIQQPFSRQVLLRSALIGLATGFIFSIAVNITSLWETAITAHYAYRKSFDWNASAHSLFSYALSAPYYSTILPLVIGFIAGVAAYAAVWSRSRQTPERAAEKGIARTFQNIRLFKHMTAIENVLVGMDRRLASRIWHDAFRLPLFWRERRRSLKEARRLLDFVGLEQHERKRSGNLSYGHQRRLEIARALAGGPDLLLLDEPAAGMNPAETEMLMELIVRIRQKGITVLLIEHHMKVVMGISDRVVVLDYGNRIAEGKPEEIRCNARVIEAYLGSGESDHARDG